MRFLVDECTGPSVARWLSHRGHDVRSLSDENPGQHDDAVLDACYREHRILITNDRDFGEQIYRFGKPHRGVVLLRLQDERPANMISVLQRLLEAYGDQLPNRFVVVRDAAVRFAAR